jgi:hypothetical protein
MRIREREREFVCVCVCVCEKCVKNVCISVYVCVNSVHVCLNVHTCEYEKCAYVSLYEKCVIEYEHVSVCEYKMR